MNYKDRAIREREQHNDGLKVEPYMQVLKHCSAYSEELKNNKIRKILYYANGKNVLEIGSYKWKKWLELNNIYPAQLDCINISDKELEKGRPEYNNKIIPNLHLMDAHELKFPDDHFHVIYGSSVLHHLELKRALNEFNRVLKKKGIIVFEEPLDINPIAKIVRYLTPFARTIDEQPFRFKELAILDAYFNIEVETYELLSVPFGVISGLIFNQPRNPLTYFGHEIDITLNKIFSPLKWFYRSMIIFGKKI
jgi:SAM-dependent methyltransferase